MQAASVETRVHELRAAGYRIETSGRPEGEIAAQIALAEIDRAARWLQEKDRQRAAEETGKAA